MVKGYGMALYEGDAGGHSNVFSSWPQRNYTCSFCRRQFNSAQALGGHMNVHRRDRAKLRQLPPASWVFGCPNTTTSSTPSNYYNNPSPTTPPKFLPYPFCIHYSLPLPLVDQCPQIIEAGFSPPNEDPTIKNTDGDIFMEDFGRRNELKYNPLMKKADREVVSLDLEIGCKDPAEEVLDLELRLGY